MSPTRIINIFKRIFSPHIETPLGRWKNHNYTKTTLKIKYANEDNCGLSSHNYTNITKIHQNNDLDDDDDEKYIYMMGYESAHK
jgi:hypothetical protein